LVLAIVLALSGTPGPLGGAGPGSCSGSEDRTAALAHRVRSEWPLRGSADPVSVYVQRLAERLLDGAEAIRRGHWRFDVARNLSANAFAVGEGYVIVTDGLVAYVRNESQLAAVLAHEMGHVLEGHFCRRAGQKGTEFRVGTLMQHYDAQAEEEADARAVVLLHRAGFDPGAMASLLRCLAARTPSFRAQLDRRIAALERQGSGSAGGYPPRDSAGFQEARRAVLEDLQGLESAAPGRGAAQPCR
jgi:predicted Zn-dependent protease